MAASLQLGPFAIEERLGGGGAGAVYLGQHVDTGRPVAVKALLADAARTEDRHRAFRREVRALAELHHPGIAAILDYGRVGRGGAARELDELAEGAPWFAMEYVDGRPIPSDPEQLEWATVESLLLAALDALGHAHARTVVHRDLKPDHMLLTDPPDADEPELTLVDFGIAQVLESAPSREEQARDRVPGTPTYMAPEQIRGAWRDQGPWTDLYALGCVAWELLCGTPPFRGGTTDAILRAHLDDDPPAFRPRIAVPEGLEAWLRGLLRTSVDGRTRRAADAAWGLLQLSKPRVGPVAGEPSSSQTASTPSTTSTDLVAPPEAAEQRDSTEGAGSVAPSTTGAAPPPVLPDWRRERAAQSTLAIPRTGLELFSLREVPIVDRRDERDRLWNAVRSLHRSRQPGLVTLEAAPGTGKTRLAQWLVRRVHETGGASTLKATHAPSAEPDAGLRDMLRRRFRTSGLSRPEVFERLLDRLPSLGRDDELRPSDARALTELLRPTDDRSPCADGPAYRFADAEQKYGLIRRLFARLARPRPLVVWFDDLHWGGAAMGVLESLFEPAGRAPPVLAVATVRSDIVADDSALRDRLDGILRDADADRIQLDPLAPRDQRRLVDRLLHLEPDLADELARRTEGNPLFAVQLVRNWVQRGVLEAGEEGYRLRDRADLEVPADIHRLWLNRLEQLVDDLSAPRDDQIWRSLELAAALGRDVDDAEWSATLETANLPRPPSLVERLVERGLAERTDHGWSFAHGLLVDSLRRRARDAGRWRDHHRTCAETLEARADRKDVGPLERFATHRIRAGEPRRALDPLLEAIELRRDRGEIEERNRLLRRRGRLLDELDVSPDDPLRLEQYVERARITADQSDLQESLELLSDVWQRLDDSDPARTRGKCAQLTAWIQSQLGHRDRARTWARTALDATRDTEAYRLRIRAHLTLAWNCVYETEHERAAPNAERAIELAERADDRYLNLEAERISAFVHAAKGEERRAEAQFERVCSRAAEAGYATVESRALNGLGELARNDHRLEEARNYYLESLRKVRELSRPLSAATAHINLAQVEIRAGASDRGLRHLRSAEDLFQKVGAEQRWESPIHVVRLAHAAEVEDREGFDRLWEPLADGWPADWEVESDHPWLLETAGESAWRAGWRDAAREIWRLTRELWELLEEDEGVRRMEERLERS